MTVIHGDCLTVMPTLPAESIDAVVCDPPYGLEFMGKEWDRLGRANQDWHYAWAVEALRVAKPGAHLLAFGGTRTYHRLACAIEDAGWEVRDCLVWAYASGFPKSHNLTGEWTGYGTALKPAWEPIILARKPLRGTVAANVTAFGTGALNIDGCRIGTTKEVPASRPMPRVASPSLGAIDTPPEGTSGFDPALGRWPANLILTDPIFDGDMPGVVGGGMQSGGGNPPFRQAERTSDDVTMGGGWQDYPTGKVPADQTGTYSRFFLIPKASRRDREPVAGGLDSRVVSVWGGDEDDLTEGKKYTVARANHHPTVKPVALMRHLVRLVTPPGGIVLDPFLGSGTTALACEAEGFGWVGIEREEEYVRIAEARLVGTPKGMGL